MEMKNLIFILSACLVLACSSSSKDDSNEDKSMEVILSAEEVAPDEHGLVSVEVSFKGISGASSLEVEKTSGMEKTSLKFGTGIFSGKSTFQYAVRQDDAASLEFSFHLNGKDGRESPVALLRVDNSASKSYTSLSATDFKVVSRITGAEDNGHDGLPSVEYEVFNDTPNRFDVGGADLGITWEISPGRYGMFFGDTFGADFKPNLTSPAPGGSNWRGNVFLFSDDNDLSDGLSISDAAVDNAGRAREICFSAHLTTGNGDYTSIPTGAVHAGGKEYVHYMNIKTWNGWISNFSSLYSSSDAGVTWNRVNSVTFASGSNFGQVGMFNHDGYVYVMGTVTGLSSKPQLARVREEDIENQSEWEFWNGTFWLKDKESLAAPLIDDFSGELSFAYLPQWGKWVWLYLNEQRNDQIIMRYADNIIGPWSDPAVLTDGRSFWRPYGSFIHPISTKGGDMLYFVMSAWNAYNTYLISCKLNSHNE